MPFYDIMLLYNTYSDYVDKENEEHEKQQAEYQEQYEQQKAEMNVNKQLPSMPNIDSITRGISNATSSFKMPKF